MKLLHAGVAFACAMLVAATAHAQKKPGCGADIPVTVRVVDGPGERIPSTSTTPATHCARTAAGCIRTAPGG